MAVAGGQGQSQLGSRQPAEDGCEKAGIERDARAVTYLTRTDRAVWRGLCNWCAARH